MTRGVRNPTRRTTLRGWMKWLPFLLLPFAVLYGETWTRAQTVNYDYEASELWGKIEAVKVTIHELRGKVNWLERKDRSRTQAETLELVEPNVGQVRELYVEIGTSRDVSEETYDVARRNAEGAQSAPPQSPRAGNE